jgi:uncharacterized integral membrane protein
MADPTAGTPEARPARGLRREQAKQIAAVVAIVLFVLFALLNTQKVTIHWIVATSQTPLIVALLVAAALGGLASLGFSHIRRRRRRSRR